MESRDEIDMTNDTVKFCVSWTTINVVKNAVRSFVLAWNAHRIPGIPNALASRAPQTPTSVIPSTAEIVRIHQEGGGALTPEHSFGRDPLESNEELQSLRERDFYQRFPSIEAVFQSTLHSDGVLFRDAIHHFIHLTITLS